MLIQSSPPHRRARSAAWTYHFYPDEAWVDITITLPCAVLLKEIHIQPHLTALASTFAVSFNSFITNMLSYTKRNVKSNGGLVINQRTQCVLSSVQIKRILDELLGFAA